MKQERSISAADRARLQQQAAKRVAREIIRRQRTLAIKTQRIWARLTFPLQVALAALAFIGWAATCLWLIFN